MKIVINFIWICLGFSLNTIAQSLNFKEDSLSIYSEIKGGGSSITKINLSIKDGKVVNDSAKFELKLVSNLINESVVSLRFNAPILITETYFIYLSTGILVTNGNGSNSEIIPLDRLNKGAYFIRVRNKYYPFIIN